MEVPRETPIQLSISLTGALLGDDRAELVKILLEYLYHVSRICELPERLNAGEDAVLYSVESELRASLKSLKARIDNPFIAPGGSNAEFRS